MTKPVAPQREALQLDGMHGSLSDPLLDAMTFLNEVTSRFPEAISFAPGRPYEGLFDPNSVHDHLTEYTEYLVRERGYTPEQVRTAVFQYGRTNGEIHELIARTLANDENLHVPPESVVVTVGAQEGMVLALRALFAEPNDVLLANSPCYIGITGAARLLDIKVIGVPETTDGLDPDRVAETAERQRAIGRRPQALYVVPDFANPSGVSMSVANRRRLLDVARAHDLLIIEDNPYGFFTRDDVFRPTLKSLDNDTRVIYLGSFAKTCFPGARLGYAIADQEVVDRAGNRTLLAEQFAKIKSMLTVNTPSLSQAVIGGILIRNNCRLREANRDTIGFYRSNMDRLLTELTRHFPPETREELGISWNTPGGGFFVVVTVPFTADADALTRSAQEYGVLWTPMSDFYLDGGGHNQLRLSCSYVEPNKLAEGIERLVKFIHAQATKA